MAGRRGGNSTGCLLSLLMLTVVAYYGVNVGELWVRYYRFIDEMDTQARLSAAIDNETIRRRLQVFADDIGLPDEAKTIVVRRTAAPREIRIESAYNERVDLPFLHHTFRFRPAVKHPL